MKKKENLKKRIARCRAAFQEHGLTLELIPDKVLLACDYERKEVVSGSPWFNVNNKDNETADYWEGFRSLIELEQYIETIPGKYVTVFVPDSPTEKTRVTNIEIVKKAFEEEIQGE
ncbi:MAG: hypothetical protein ACLQQ4_06505 [Bacteroidia bacterium]